MGQTITRAELGGTEFGDVATTVRLPPVTPGEVLLHEFMRPLGLSALALARELGVPVNRVTKIVRGERTVTADTALRLARHFRTSPEFWLNLQNAFDLEEARSQMAAA